MASREVLLMRKIFEDHETERKRGDDREEEDSDNRLLVVNYGEWEREQKACREGRKVVALEITDPFSDSCSRIRPHFARLAKEFESCPFIRVVTGPPPFIPIDKVSRDVGPVREIPAILLLYYDKQDHIKRKSYQGEAAIRIAFQNGELKRKFKEFIAERSLSEEDDDTDTKTASAEQHPGFSKAADDDDSTATQEKSTSRPSTARQVSSGHIIKRQDVEVGDRIGQGRFGVVFQAMWKRKRVAVKTCAGNLLETGDAEVDILASLPPHPNVLKFFGVAVSEDKLHSLIVTELAAGGSLSATLHGTNREKPMAAQSLGWALQIASGMEHLHSHDIIHRDLKSPNVLLAHGYLKVCDFGTARHLSETCVPTGQAGTYRWMAPEIIEEHAKINKKCDVFSYGMMLYEIYEVKVPFAEIQSDMRVCYAIMEGKRPPIPAKLPTFLRPLLEDCWRKDSAQRPSFATIIMTIQTEFYEKE